MVFTRSSLVLSMVLVRHPMVTVSVLMMVLTELSVGINWGVKVTPHGNKFGNNYGICKLKVGINYGVKETPHGNKFGINYGIRQYLL